MSQHCLHCSSGNPELTRRPQCEDVIQVLAKSSRLLAMLSALLYLMAVTHHTLVTTSHNTNNMCKCGDGNGEKLQSVGEISGRITIILAEGFYDG